MTEQQSHDTAWYSINGKRVQANWCFQYRGVGHVGDPLKFANEDEFKASVIQKYKNIDAGLNPDGTPKPVKAKVASGGLAPGQIKGFKQEYHNAAMARENADLREQLSQLQQQVALLSERMFQVAGTDPDPHGRTVQQDDPGSGDGSEDERPVIPLARIEPAAVAQEAEASPKEGATAEPKAVMAGNCPKCGQHFKRLDMHAQHCKGAAGSGVPGAAVAGTGISGAAVGT